MSPRGGSRLSTPPSPKAIPGKLLEVTGSAFYGNGGSWHLPVPTCSEIPSRFVFFFQEECNEAPCSVTTGSQRGLSGDSGDRKHTPPGTWRCTLCDTHKQGPQEAQTAAQPTTGPRKCLGTPSWDTQTYTRTGDSQRPWEQHLLSTYYMPGPGYGGGAGGGAGPTFVELTQLPPSGVQI